MKRNPKKKRVRARAVRRKRTPPRKFLRKKTPARPKPAVARKEAVIQPLSKTAPPPEKKAIHPPQVFRDLPFSYGETKLVLMVRDPYWAYSYWDFSGETWHWAQKKLAEDSSLRPILRISDLDAKRFYQLSVALEVKNWYVHLGIPDHRYVGELGLGDGNSRFHLIARSNEVKTPRDSPSEVIDQEWAPENFDEIYRLSGGGKPGLSSPGSLFIPRQT